MYDNSEQMFQQIFLYCAWLLKKKSSSVQSF